MENKKQRNGVKNVENYCRKNETRNVKNSVELVGSSSSFSSTVKAKKGKRNNNMNSSSSSNSNGSSFHPTSSHVELLTDLISLFVPEYGDFLHCTKCLTSFSDFSLLAHHFKNCGREKILTPAPELGQLPDPHPDSDSDNSLDFNLDPSKFLIPETCVSFFPLETEENETAVNTKEESYDNDNNNNYDASDMDNITIKSETESSSVSFEEPPIKIEPEWESECENVDFNDNGNLDVQNSSSSSLSHFLQPSPHDSVVYKISKEVQERIKSGGSDKVTQRLKTKRTRMTKPKPTTNPISISKPTKEKEKEKVKEKPKKEQVKTKTTTTKTKTTKTTKQKLQCSFGCSMTFKSSEFHSKHEKSHKIKEKCQYDGPGFKCDHPNCNKILLNMHTLGNHKKTHWPEESRTCPICGVIFSTPFYIKNHVKFTHQLLKEFVCETCGKRFAKAPQLTDHLRTHSKERPYLCPLCGQTFALRTGLRRHQIVHTKIKRFKCDFCDKRFTGNQMRRFHMARKTCLKNKEKADQNDQNENQEKENENESQVNQNNIDETN